MKLALPIDSALVLLGMLAVGACGGPETGNPSFTLEVALTATSTDESAVAVRDEGAGLSVEEAWISFRSLELVPCSTDVAPLSQPDYPLDLTADPPALAAFESGVSDYCGLRLGVGPSRGSEPRELDGLSLHVRGARSDGVPFELRSALTADVDLMTLSGSALGARHLALGFDLATWFAAVDVQGASETDGVVPIDSTSNTTLLEAFEGNTSIAVALYVDADRDGVLDADELAPIAVSP